MIPPIYFIIPDYTRFISGGNLYNQQLIEALQQQAKNTIIVWTIDELRTHFSTITAGIFFVDSLYLDQIARFLYFKKTAQQFHLIVHHLQSLFPPEQYTSATYFEEKEQRILQGFDGFLTTSQYTATYLAQRGLPQPIIVAPPDLGNIPNAIPLRQSSPIKALVVANVVRRKGILPLIRACKKLKNHSITIEIAGSRSFETGYAAICTTVVEQHPSLKQHIHFLDTLSPRAMQEKYQTCNVLISSSFFETYGMALQEAVAWGLPILAIKGGNVSSHIKEGVNGYLFEEAVSLVEKLISLADNPLEMERLLQQTAKYKGQQSLNWTELARQILIKVGAFKSSNL